MTLTKEQKDAIIMSLNYWANYIETGDLTLTAEDAESAGKPFKALNLEKMRCILFIRDLAAQVAKDK
jgi:hypothetical protein